ncbi:MAG: nucleotidyl transferase AbiEii/AbiGii toxin family protein [Bacteroidales bacterium]|nr:nucleotidyl transferase AbiEii/AbiGii toxin family protein [Bacteroidales bacterium]
MHDLKALMPKTVSILEKLSKLDFLRSFTFVGGSALSVYLQHRLSEDIDLFTWHKKLDTNVIQDSLNELNLKNVRIINISEKQCDYILDEVKVSFFANNWNELKKRTAISGNLFISNLETIAVMKVNTLFMRAKFRDYYDLYVINLKHFSLPELFEMTNSKMNNLNLTLFQRALCYTDDIEDENIEHLKLKYNVDIKEIEKHFIKKIKEMNKYL